MNYKFILYVSDPINTIGRPIGSRTTLAHLAQRSNSTPHVYNIPLTVWKLVTLCAVTQLHSIYESQSTS